MSSEEKINQKIRLLVVLGSGGHTTEMINIIENLDVEKYGPKTYLYSSTDNMSKRKVESIFSNEDDVRIYFQRFFIFLFLCYLRNYLLYEKYLLSGNV